VTDIVVSLLQVRPAGCSSSGSPTFAPATSSRAESPRLPTPLGR